MERAEERLEQELGKLHAGLSKPRSTKRLEKRSGSGSGGCGRSTRKHRRTTRSRWRRTGRARRRSR